MKRWKESEERKMKQESEWEINDGKRNIKKYIKRKGKGDVRWEKSKENMKNKKDNYVEYLKKCKRDEKRYYKKQMER